MAVKGNMNYATATMQAPQYAQPGQEATRALGKT